MENKTLEMPAMSKYIIRSTGEEVEVIDSNIANRGERSEDDWVTYIDSKGIEHIKEHLNMQLDFKPGRAFEDILTKMFDTHKFEPTKFPSIENTRAFEMAKELVVQKGDNVEHAVNTAKQLVEYFKE